MILNSAGLKLIILCFLPTTFCEDVVSTENKDTMYNERTDKHNANADARTFRRFNEGLYEEEWHVSHLKDTDFAPKSECPGDTLEDKIRKYRRAVRNDAARVEFVFAEPLPFNETEILNEDTCPGTNITNDGAGTTNSKSYKETKVTETAKDNVTIEKNENATDEHNSATTANSKSTKVKIENVTAQEKSRRASEYQFSSVEYYDEITEFDESLCPHAIKVITLQQDQLRNYDVECEMIIEWRSLDN